MSRAPPSAAAPRLPSMAPGAGAVVLGRLHVRPGGAGRPGRGRRVGQHDGAVGRAPRVVHHARQVDALAVEQRRQHGPLQLAPAQGRQLRLDAGPRDLVTEPHHLAVALQHPGVQARFEIRARGRDRGLDQPQLGAPRHHGDQLDHLPRGRLEARRPGQHRVAHGAGRHLVLRPPPGPRSRRTGCRPWRGGSRLRPGRRGAPARRPPRGTGAPGRRGTPARAAAVPWRRAGRVRPRRCGRSRAGSRWSPPRGAPERSSGRAWPRRPSGRPR